MILKALDGVAHRITIDATRTTVGVKLVVKATGQTIYLLEDDLIKLLAQDKPLPKKDTP